MNNWVKRRTRRQLTCEMTFFPAGTRATVTGEAHDKSEGTEGRSPFFYSNEREQFEIRLFHTFQAIYVQMCLIYLKAATVEDVACNQLTLAFVKPAANNCYWLIYSRQLSAPCWISSVNLLHCMCQCLSVNYIDYERKLSMSLLTTPSLLLQKVEYLKNVYLVQVNTRKKVNWVKMQGKWVNTVSKSNQVKRFLQHWKGNKFNWIWIDWVCFNVSRSTHLYLLISSVDSRQLRRSTQTLWLEVVYCTNLLSELCPHPLPRLLS